MHPTRLSLPALFTLLVALAPGLPGAPARALACWAATEAIDAAAAPTSSAALQVYLTCTSCDRAYLETRVNFVQFVRSPESADVAIVLTTNQSTSGGSVSTLTLLGQARCLGIADTLVVAVASQATESAARNALAIALSAALARYCARCGSSEHIPEVAPASPLAGTVEPDRWNHWVITGTVNGSASGQSSTSQGTLSASLAASRVTDASRLGMSLSTSHAFARYDVGGDAQVRNYSRARGVDLVAAMAASEHLSVGLQVASSASTYGNIADEFSGNIGIEFNFFPFSEATERQLRVAYRVGGRAIDYVQPTVLNVESERVGQHKCSVTFDRVSLWGTARVSLDAASYFDRFSSNHVQGFLSLAIRLNRFVLANVTASGSRIHDQREVPRASPVPEDVLLQRRLLETQYDYSVSLGVTVTAGSIYSTVANLRFGN